MLIRFFDQSEVDNCKISEAVAQFVNRLQSLFAEQYVWTVPGFTSETLAFLATDTHFRAGETLRRVGGAGSVSDEVKSRCISRMQAWARLAEEVVRAEHPDSRLCYLVYRLEYYL